MPVWGGLLALLLIFTPPCARASYELTAPQLLAPVERPAFPPRPATGLLAPPFQVARSEWPELWRPWFAKDDLLPTQEEATLRQGLRLIRSGRVAAGERRLREIATGATSATARVAAWVELGVSLLRRGQAEDAAAALGAAREEWGARPDPWRISFWVGMALAESGQDEAAAAALTRAADGAPEGGRVRAVALRWAGWLRADLGDLKAAAALWQRSLEQAGPFAGLADSLRMDLAEVAFEAGDWQSVLHHLERPGDPPPPSARRALLLGRANLELGRMDSARVVLNRLVTRWPDASPVWLDEARVILGWIALKRGETDEALANYEQVTGERITDLPPSTYGSAVALMTQGRFAEAEELLAPAAPVAAEDPLYFPWAYALAYARFNLDRHREAITSLEAFRGHVAADTLGRAAWSLRGDCYFRLGEPEEAFASYVKAASLLPTVPDLLLRRQALAAIAAGQWGTAARILGDLIVKYPGTPHAGEYHFWRAEAFYRLGRTEMARRHYLRAERRGADKAQCAYALGWCDYDEGHYPEALVHFDRALRYCNDCSFMADLFLRRGNCLFNVGRIAEAGQAFADAAEATVASPRGALHREATFRHAWALLRMEDFAAAQEAFARIREREGNTSLGAEALYWEGQALFRQEAYRPALAQLRALVEHPAVSDSMLARGLLALGDGHYNLGEYREALEWYRRILEAPGADRTLRRTAHESLFECRSARGEWDQADQILGELKANFPESRGLGEKHLRLADGLFADGRSSAALDAYGDFLEQADPADPRQPRVHYQIAQCRELLGQKAEAAAAYEALGDQEDFRERSTALLRAGKLRLALKQPRKALRPLERRLALNLEPGQVALTRAFLAEAYQRLEETQAARNEWEKVMHERSGAPDSLRAIAGVQLGRIAFTAQEWDAAFAAFAAADTLGLVPGVYRVRYWAGEAAYRTGDLLRASAWLRGFLERGEEHLIWEATARIRLAECYEGLGQPRQALEQYRLVLDLPLEEQGLLNEARRRSRALAAEDLGGEDSLASRSAIEDSSRIAHGGPDR